MMGLFLSTAAVGLSKGAAILSAAATEAQRQHSREDTPVPASSSATMYSIGATPHEGAGGIIEEPLSKADKRALEMPTCWCDYSAPKAGCLAFSLKAICIAPAGVAYTLGLAARIADDALLCVCLPCVGNAYAAYKLEQMTERAGVMILKHGTNKERIDAGTLARNAREATVVTAQEVDCMMRCVHRWMWLRRLNGKLFVPTGCPCGVCCQEINPWPRSIYDLEGHCLEAPCQVMMMDKH